MKNLVKVIMSWFCQIDTKGSKRQTNSKKEDESFLELVRKSAKQANKDQMSVYKQAQMTI